MEKQLRLDDLVKELHGSWLQKGESDMPFAELLTDSRRLGDAASTLFVAIPGSRLNGHDYLEELYRKGVRNFLVSEEAPLHQLQGAHVLKVKNTLQALQKLAAWKRRQFSFPVIGITGSNGKTIVKEWLYQLLHEDFHIVRSPKSYNSQLGVPLSLWQMDETHNLGIFEAGISEPGEMEKLESMIRPEIGLFTNIGEAHSEGFLNIRHKTKEKLKLFVQCKVLVYCMDYPDINQSIAEINALSKSAENHDNKIKTFSWSFHADSDLQVKSLVLHNNRAYLSCQYGERLYDLELPFTDKASVENALHCCALMLYLGYGFETIASRVKNLSRIAMRLEMKEAQNNCILINDSYNSDMGSLRIALDFLNQQNRTSRKTVILSDILQSGKGEIELYEEVGKMLSDAGVHRLIGVGPALSRQRKYLDKSGLPEIVCYKDTEDLLSHYEELVFLNESILLKGARKFKFEIIGKLLEKKAHETVLEINLNALIKNLKTYQNLLNPDTKVMAMVKAFSYGSGSFEIANALQFNRVDYLAVAYADEGVELRKAGISLPIMVMNPEQRSFETMLSYRLEPDLFNLPLFRKFAEAARIFRGKRSLQFRIHLELETGMNRLGFAEKDLPELCSLLKEHCELLEVASVFSHLSASEDSRFDDFTESQIERFERMSLVLSDACPKPFLRHILNTGGILRHSRAQFDMVRLGIGLYGVDASAKIQSKLENVSTFKTTIAQIKEVEAGESVGYGRAGRAESPMRIATVRVGYADGLPRSLSQGKGYMSIHGQKAPIIGNICMDMSMLDITGLEHVNEGDEVIIFGHDPDIRSLAQLAGTIPYELLTGISQRVKRIYYQE